MNDTSATTTDIALIKTVPSPRIKPGGDGSRFGE